MFRSSLANGYLLSLFKHPPPARRLFSQLLTPEAITKILIKDQITLDSRQYALPNCIKSIECNQLAANNPIEDRIRLASIQFPDHEEPTLIGAVFDGHGGDTTADFISSRLFSYIALSLHPNPGQLDGHDKLESLVNHLHSSPKLKHDLDLRALALGYFARFSDELQRGARAATVEESLKISFKKCDEDLSGEIQHNLQETARDNKDLLHYYLSAAVSGCCAVVLVVHKGMGYLASVGDCRAVLSVHEDIEAAKLSDQGCKFDATELNDEHNCDNIQEVRRLAAAHPKSELNTIIRHNRLLGHLMPFRAFGDFTYKWPASLIDACGITRAFGAGVIPSHYNTPPYLIADPDITTISISETADGRKREILIASDGLWELFESSREVVEAVIKHSAGSKDPSLSKELDENCSTHLIRTALDSIGQVDSGLEPNEIRRQRYLRLVSMLTLPKGAARNFRDDISAIVIKLQ